MWFQKQIIITQGEKGCEDEGDGDGDVNGSIDIKWSQMLKLQGSMMKMTCRAPKKGKIVILNTKWGQSNKVFDYKQLR